MHENKFNLHYFGLNLKKEIETELMLDVKNSINSIILKNDDFVLRIIFSDLVDLDEFRKLLEQEKKKIQILSHLTRNNKEYKGKRKYLWKKDKIIMSQGGIRIEFDEELIEKFKSIVKFIKESYKNI